MHSSNGDAGLLLLDRSRRAIRLTPAGANFAGLAGRLLEQAGDASRQARQIACGDAGEITISFTAAVSYVFIPRLVSLLRQEHPAVDLTLRELTTPQQLVALAGRQVDICLLRPPITLPGIRALLVESECLVAAVPQDHPLARKEIVRLAAINGEALVTYPPVEGPYFHGTIMGLLQAAGVYPASVQYITQTHAILGLVAAGIGVALVPQSARACCPAGVALRPLAGAEGIQAELFLAWLEQSGNPVSGPVLRTLQTLSML
ncbi:LysR substrate-binding domain-containing protein [Bosea thiooxidans]